MKMSLLACIALLYTHTSIAGLIQWTGQGNGFFADEFAEEPEEVGPEWKFELNVRVDDSFINPEANANLFNFFDSWDAVWTDGNKTFNLSGIGNEGLDSLSQFIVADHEVQSSTICTVFCSGINPDISEFIVQTSLAENQGFFQADDENAGEVVCCVQGDFSWDTGKSLTNVSAPGSILLLSSAAAGLVCLRRRKVKEYANDVIA